MFMASYIRTGLYAIQKHALQCSLQALHTVIHWASRAGKVPLTPPTLQSLHVTRKFFGKLFSTVILPAVPQVPRCFQSFSCGTRAWFSTQSNPRPSKILSVLSSMPIPFIYQQKSTKSSAEGNDSLWPPSQPGRPPEPRFRKKQFRDPQKYAKGFPYFSSILDPSVALHYTFVGVNSTNGQYNFIKGAVRVDG